MVLPQVSTTTLTAAILSTVVFCVVVCIGFVVKGIILAKLLKLAGKTSSGIDNAILAAVKTPSIIWIIMLGLYAGLSFSNIGEGPRRIIEQTLLVAGLCSLTMAVSGLVCQLIRDHVSKFGGTSGGTSGGSSGGSLIQTIARIVIWVTGVMVILSSLGVSISPVLATLGVGGLAVALALQDTLANLFAGVHINLNKIVRIGDYIQLETGPEGYVTDVNWRTTTIRMPANNMILVPNSKLAQSIVTNYYYPSKDLSIMMPVGVHYKSDLRRIERVTIEVAREVMEQVPGGVPEFAPVIRYNAFGDSSIRFNVILRVKEYMDQHLVRHEFIMRLHERYAREGINIPYPICAVNTTQEQANL